MAVDPSSINNQIAAQLPTNTTGKISPSVLVGALTGGAGGMIGLTAWIVANFVGISTTSVIHTSTYGSICDGQHHPLSGVSSALGQTTTSWTLAQWQAKLPSAVSLTDEIDGLAISAAFRAAAATLKPYYLKIDGTNCFGSQGIDNTNSNIKDSVIDYSGTNVYSTVTGHPAIDFTGLQFATVLEPYVTGDVTKEPYDAYAVWRKAAGTGTGNLLIVRPKADGNFSHCALDNVQTELVTITRPLLNNFDPSGGRAICLDGVNHYNAAAAAQYLVPTQAVDTYQSFTQGTIRDGLAVCASCDGPVFFAGLHGWRIENLYTNNNNPTITNKYGYMVWETSDGPNTGVDISFSRSEGYAGAGNGITNDFYITGTWATPTLYDFSYRNPSDWATVSIFKTDPAITLGTLRNVDITVDGFSTGGVPVVWDNPALWTGSGNIRLPVATNWNMPTGVTPSGNINVWSGRICIVNSCFDTLTAQRPLTVFGEFNSDQYWEQTQTTTIPLGSQFQLSDGWVGIANGAAAAKAVAQDKSDFACGGAYNDMVLSVTTPLTVGAADNLAIRTAVPGLDLQSINWGKGNAGYIIVDIWLSANYTGGSVPIFFTNNAGTRLLAHDLTLPAINTCQEYVFAIPPYTNPIGFNTAANAVGMRAGISPDCGANYQVTPDTWTTTASQPSACTANVAHFLAGGSNVLKISSLRFYAMPTIPYVPQFLPTPYAALHEIAASLFHKTVNDGTAPCTSGTYKNCGLNGAVTFTAAATGAVTQYVSFSPPLSSATTASPVVSAFSTGAATTNCYDVTGAADIGAATITNIANSGATLNCAGATVGHQIAVQMTEQAIQ